MKQYIALDIGGTNLKYGVVNEKGEVLHYNEVSVDFDNYETPIIETIVKTLKRFIDKKYDGIAVSATGQIDCQIGKVIGVGGNIKNYLGTPIKTILESHFHLPTTVLNDANAVAAAEKWIGAAKDFSHALVVTIGTGVGGGIITHNVLLQGSIGIAGEIGHFSIAKEGKKCSCGNDGCFEQYASMRALVNTVNQTLNTNYNGRDIFEKYENPQIFALIDKWIEDIATGIASLVHIFNPQIVIVGGGVSSQYEKFIVPLQKKLQKLIMPRFYENLQVSAAALTNQAGMIGAVYDHITR